MLFQTLFPPKIIPSALRKLLCLLIWKNKLERIKDLPKIILKMPGIFSVFRHWKSITLRCISMCFKLTNLKNTNWRLHLKCVLPLSFENYDTLMILNFTFMSDKWLKLSISYTLICFILNPVQLFKSPVLWTSANSWVYNL